MNARSVNFLCGIVFFATLIVSYVPIAAVGIAAFFPSVAGKVDFTEPTFQFFLALLANASVVEALLNSVVAAVSSTALSLLAAGFYAAFLRKKSLAIRFIFEMFIFAPFFLPPIVVGLSLLLASAESGFPRGMATIVIGHALFTVSIVYKIIQVRLANLPASLENASADLGASKLQTIRFVILPHLASAFLAAGILSALLSFDETLITALVAGETTTLPLRLWAMMRLGFTPSINALVVIVISLCLIMASILLVVLNRSIRRP